MTTQFKNHADSMLSIELENKMMVFLPTATVFSSDGPADAIAYENINVKTQNADEIKITAKAINAGVYYIDWDSNDKEFGWDEVYIADIEITITNPFDCPTVKITSENEQRILCPKEYAALNAEQLSIVRERRNEFPINEEFCDNIAYHVTVK